MLQYFGRSCDEILAAQSKNSENWIKKIKIFCFDKKQLKFYETNE